MLYDPEPPPFIGIEEPETFFIRGCFGAPESAVRPANAHSY